jgi:DNA-binding SARP family transcriptional activator
MFWPEGSQQQAGAYLRQALWDLTRSLGEDSVVRERQSVYFNPQLEIWADVNDFVSALESWKAGTIRPPAAIHHLAKAVSLYQDDFLTGFSLRDSPSFDDWQTAHTELLRI